MLFPMFCTCPYSEVVSAIFFKEYSGLWRFFTSLRYIQNDSNTKTIISHYSQAPCTPLKPSCSQTFLFLSFSEE